MNGVWTLAALEARWPGTPWREPIVVATIGARGYACRVCIANHGLHAAQIRELPNDPAVVVAHIAEEHE